jgi:hypothetical protein
MRDEPNILAYRLEQGGAVLAKRSEIKRKELWIDGYETDAAL